MLSLCLFDFKAMSCSERQSNGPQSCLMTKIRVLIVDNHPVVREALAARLSSSPNIEVLATAPDVQESLCHATDITTDVILLDGRLVRGADRANVYGQMIRQLGTDQTAIIVLSTYADDKEREAVLRAGAKRYLLKDLDSAGLIAEIEAVASEQSG